MCGINIYMDYYLDIIENYTPSKACKLRRLRAIIQQHKRDCPECHYATIKSNYNLEPPRRVLYRMGRGKP